MDQRFRGDWPTLLEAPGDWLRAVFLGDPNSPDGGIVRTGRSRPGPPAAEPAPPRSGLLLVSVMVDVEAALERLATLGLGGRPRRIEVSGIAMAVVHDPDGVQVELVDTGGLGQPRAADAAMRTKPTVAVLGAGAGGIAMGIRLKRAGYDFTIYEQSDGVGGPGGTTPTRGRLRRPVPPLLLFVRTNPCGAVLRHPTGDPGLPGGVHRSLRGPSPRPDRYPDRRGQVGRVVPGLGPHHVDGGAVPGRRGGERTRHAQRAPRPPHPRCGALHGPCLPLVALGPFDIAGRPAGGLDRDRCQCRPVRARHRPRRRAPDRVPTPRPSGSPRDTTGPTHRSSNGTSPGSPWPPVGTAGRYG